MSWYKATVAHDRMRVGQVYWLEDTAYTAARVDKGYLLPDDEPPWNQALPEDRKWPSSSETTAPSQ